jgi:hypothetical protein
MGVVSDPLTEITRPLSVFGSMDVLGSPSVVPAVSGIYGWYFRQSPHPRIDPLGCTSFDGMPLLYVGIAPKAPPASARPSTQTIRDRIRYHYRGNAEGSTLRLTLGCLLAETLGIKLRRVGSGRRLTFTFTGEQKLSAWMAENAFVTWVETVEPWLWEDAALKSLDLPLNLSGNGDHPFHSFLTSMRAAAKAEARRLDITT